MLPLPIVRDAVARGVSLVCATCARYAEGRARGLPDDRCTAPTPCTGPFAGSTFPLYDGPLTDFARWCLRCGSPAHAAIRVVGTDRAFGLCLLHISDAYSLAPVSGDPHHFLELLRPQGLVQVQNMVRLPRPFTRKSMTDLLAEIEAERASVQPP